MRTEFVIDYDPGMSGVANELFCVMIDRVVDLKITDNTGYPSEHVYVVRVDGDGDLVVCETEGGLPLENATWAIPQALIERVMIVTGNYA